MSNKRKANIIIAFIVVFVWALKAYPPLNEKWENFRDFIYKNYKETTYHGSRFLPPNYRIVGIDVSHHQRRIIWEDIQKDALEGEPVTFVFIKATEGKNFKDKKFKRNWQKAKSIGLIRGAYHYFKPDVDATLQAKNFISKVKIDRGDLPPVLDVEETGEKNISATRQSILKWMQLIEKQYSIAPIIYTNPEHYRTYFNGQKSFKIYKFWIANYYKSRPSIRHKDVLFWQYTDLGSIKGIYEKVDLNVFMGKKEELLSLCK